MHSNISPILFKNSSTWGRFSTYTYRTDLYLLKCLFRFRSAKMLYRLRTFSGNSDSGMFVLVLHFFPVSCRVRGCGQRSWTKSSRIGYAYLNKPILDYLNQAQTHSVAVIPESLKNTGRERERERRGHRVKTWTLPGAPFHLFPREWWNLRCSPAVRRVRSVKFVAETQKTFNFKLWFLFHHITISWCSMSNLKGAVDQCLIQINDHTDLSRVFWLHWRQQWLHLVLGDGSVLLDQQGGIVVDWLGLGLVPTQAAEEAGEKAPAAGLLGGNGGRRTYRRSQ